MADRHVASRAHEVAEALPVWSGVYVCMRCGQRGSLRTMFCDLETRCVPHQEFANSGWLNDG